MYMNERSIRCCSSTKWRFFEFISGILIRMNLPKDLIKLKSVSKEAVQIPSVFLLSTKKYSVQSMISFCRSLPNCCSLNKVFRNESMCPIIKSKNTFLILGLPVYIYINRGYNFQLLS